MAFDPQILLNMPPLEVRQKINPFKIMLYALGIGATELQFTYEEDLQAIPCMAATMAYAGSVWRDPNVGATWQKMLHVATSTTFHASLPLEGELIGLTRFGPILDKGADRGAMVYQTREIHTAQGLHVATVQNTNFLRADGGFGGTAHGGPDPAAIPDRAPDLIKTLPTRSDQALLYRLATGDMNPLHASPAMARAMGFDRPILHGMATYGIACRALLGALAGNAPQRMRRLDARFTAPVYPGESIETRIWHVNENASVFQSRAAERDVTVLDNGYVERI